MKIVATIEARMDSARLPGKALADIDGVTAIGAAELIAFVDEMKT